MGHYIHKVATPLKLSITKEAMVPSEISFKQRSASVTEGDGNISIVVERTGDLSEYSNVIVQEAWNDNDTTISQSEISYNNAFNDGGNIRYNHDLKNAIVTFPPGVSERKLVFHVSDDTLDENSERLYLKITNAGNATIGSRDEMYIKVRDNDESIKLKVNNTHADEGKNLNFTVRAEDPVPHDTEVFLQVQTSTTAGIAAGNWWVGGVIKAGKTSVKVPIKTLADDQFGDKRVDVKLFTYHEDAVITDDTAVGTVDDVTTAVVLPKVYIDNAGTVNEGDFANFNVRVEGDFSKPIEVELFTWKTSEGNQGGNGTDYDGFVSKTITFQPNESKTHTESIFIKPDSVKDDGETFELRIEKVSSNAEIGDYRGVATIKDVSSDPDLADTIPLPDMDTANSTPSTIGLDDLVKQFRAQAESVATGAELTLRVGEAMSADQVAILNQAIPKIRDENWIYGGYMTSEGRAEIKLRLNDIKYYENLMGNISKFTDALPSVAEGAISVGTVALDGNLTSEKGVETVVDFTVGATATAATGIVLGTLFLAGTPTGWTIMLVGATDVVVGAVVTNHLDDAGVNDAVGQMLLEALDKANGIIFDDNSTQDIADTTGQGGDFPTPDPVWNGTDAAETNEYWQDKVSNANEFVNGGAGYDFILGSGGDDVINGEADSGQVNLFGPGAIRANFSVTTLGDGGYQVHSIDGSFGTDKYHNIDGAWFGGYGNIPGAWHNMADLVINTFSDGDGTLPSVTDPYDELFAGTSGDDLIIGGAGIDWFTATPGNDILYGGNGKDNDSSWNQVNFLNVPFSEIQWGYDIASDLLFSRHPDFGLDSYNRDITDFWAEDGGWHGRAELIGLADPEFVFV